MAKKKGNIVLLDDGAHSNIEDILREKGKKKGSNKVKIIILWTIIAVVILGLVIYLILR